MNEFSSLVNIRVPTLGIMPFLNVTILKVRRKLANSSPT